MNPFFQSNKQRTVTAAVSAALFFVIVHGYRLMSPLLSGDGLLMLYQNDAAWQIALGRFAHPFLVMLRGGITSPFLVSVLALCWTCASVCLVSAYLDLKKRLSVILLAALMVCHPSLIVTSANFLHEFDFYALALFLSVGSVCLLAKSMPQAAGTGAAAAGIPSAKQRYLCLAGSVLCLAGACAIYQAYVCVAAGLVMLRLLFAAARNTELRALLKEMAVTLGVFLVTALLYLLCWKLMQSALGIWTADTYNGLAGMGDFSEEGILSVLGITYVNVWKFFTDPQLFVTTTFRGFNISTVWHYLLLVCNVCVVGTGLYALWRINREEKTGSAQRVWQLLILLLFPLGINAVCFLSKGMEHTLMVYAFVLVYAFAICAWERYSYDDGAVRDPVPGERTDSASDSAGRKTAWKRTLMIALPVALLVWSQIVFANQLYFKKDLQERAAQSMMTRILSGVEAQEGYVPGETKVAVTGIFDMNPYLKDIDFMEELLPWQTGKTIFVYFGTDEMYLRYFEQAKVNLVRIDRMDPRLDEIPCWPEEGSITWLDDTIVVKVSDE